jgi:hypothetical protein
LERAFGPVGASPEHAVENVDGVGGLLLMRAPDLVPRAKGELARGEPADRVIGRYTGAGIGLPAPVLPDGTPAPLRVVQRVTPAGAVALERWSQTTRTKTPRCKTSPSQAARYG